MSTAQKVPQLFSNDEKVWRDRGRILALHEAGEEVVISGISGTFPESENVRIFEENLLAKKDLITDDDRRWKLYDVDVPNRMGKLKEIDKFDAVSFGISHTQAKQMDPQGRILLEKVYEAIVDAGYNPKEFRGSRMGVFVGASEADNNIAARSDRNKIGVHTIPGGSRAMLANRISYWLDVHGVSYNVDTACSSAVYAFEQAYRAIRSGDCTSAIVGGCNICLLPDNTIAFMRLGVLSPDGRCKCFDESGDGYVRSEAVVAMLLQKKKDARRMYARVVHAKANCDGYKDEGVHVPSAVLQQKLLEEIYEDCRTDPGNVEYLEAHATGTKVGDPAEMKAVEAVFLRNRKEPLKIGSVKSNMGHSEPASGLCSIVKIILGFESGLLAPNINFNKPRSDIEILNNGKLTVITEPTKWNVGLAAVNNFGFGGANCHVLLEPNSKVKLSNNFQDGTPRLVCVSGRTAESVQTILNDLEKRSLDIEYIGLFHEIHKYDLPVHGFRGYTILMEEGNERIRNIQQCPSKERPIWFVFAGVGSQWPTMGKALMKLPVFERSVRKSHQMLVSKGVNVLEILTKEDKSIFDNVLNTFVGIVAVEIALVDLLMSVGVRPQGYVGHSLGELACAYTDGCVTADQAILIAYYRGLSILETEYICGSMAAVGMNSEQIKDIIPTDIDIACHNGPRSVTVSGPVEAVQAFVEYLNKSGVVARPVNSSHIPLHSRYIKEAGAKLQRYCKKIIAEPQLRSQKWISSSFLEGEWNLESCKYSSAEYFVKNAQGTVYFEEACRHIPENAIVIEVAPHGLLQAILKQTSSTNKVNIPLTSRNDPNNLLYLLAALGKIYEAGANPQISKLYPPINFPVSRGTPMISPIIEWDHSKTWFVFKDKEFDRIKLGQRDVNISLKDKKYEYLSGHKIQDNIIYPASGYLILVWETFSWMLGKSYVETSVEFRDIRFKRVTKITSKGKVKFHVSIKKNTGDFEILQKNDLLVSGKIFLLENAEKISDIPLVEENELKNLDLPGVAEDMYKICRLNGHNFEGLFRGIKRFNHPGTIALISWTENFVCFLDNLLQIYSYMCWNITSMTRIPMSIEKLVINVGKHFSILNSLNSKEPEFLSCGSKTLQLLRCGGIEIKNIYFSRTPPKKPRENHIMESINFIPNINSKLDGFNHAIPVCLQLILENLKIKEVKTVELVDEFTHKDEPILSFRLSNAFDLTPFVKAKMSVAVTEEYSSITDENNQQIEKIKKLPGDGNQSLVIVSQVHKRMEILQSCLTSLHEEGFLLTRETLPVKLDTKHGIDAIFQCSVGGEELSLYRKTATNSVNKNIGRLPVQIHSKSFSWVTEAQKTLDSLKSNDELEVIFYAQNDPVNGILGFFNCLDKEINVQKCRCFFIIDENMPEFSVHHPFYQAQLLKNMKVNVFKNGTWGTYRRLPLPQTYIPSPSACLDALVYGDLSTLRWITGPVNPESPSENGNVIIHVYNAALNFRDVMIATKRISQSIFTTDDTEQGSLIGTEFSGRTKDGRRYMGFAKGRCIANVVEARADNIWSVPDHWTLADAATVPVVYSTVMYALLIRGGLKKGESILIHSGAGGIGLAAIRICLHHECEIFTTVGTPEKKEFLLKTFPTIPPNHIGNSRNDSFELLIMSETNGKGVNLVLNSLTEEKLRASVRCLSVRGRFLELGKFDLANDEALGMRCFLKEISFHGIDLGQIFEDEVLLQEIDKLMRAYIKNGVVKPLPKIIFGMAEAEKAFRYMLAGHHIGKILIKIREDELELFLKPNNILIEALPKYVCWKEKTYVLCGGLGGVGIELATQLVQRGARKLILNSRRGIADSYTRGVVSFWRLKGVQVIVSTDVITEEEGVRNLLRTAVSVGPVSAIFNLAAVLEDNLFKNQTEESFRSTSLPKFIATYHLDRISEELCPHLEHFVVFSSVACGLGNGGQTNYGLSNSYMERICEMRRARNLPALAVEFGPIADVGMMSPERGLKTNFAFSDIKLQSRASIMEILDRALYQAQPLVLSMVVEKNADTRSEDKGLTSIIGSLLGVQDLKSINTNSALSQFGMDSMMVIEIKEILQKQFDIELSVQEIANLTFAKLLEMENKKVEMKVDNYQKFLTTFFDTETLIGPTRIEQIMKEFPRGIRKMPSLLDQTDAAEVSLDKHPTLFILPSIIGYSGIVTKLSERLKAHVFCVQYDYEGLEETFEEIAKTLLPEIVCKNPLHQKFYFIGISWGGHMALEIIRLLEMEGKSCRVWLIDSSIYLFKSVIYQIVGLKEEDVKANRITQMEVCKLFESLARSNIDGMSPDKSILPLRESFVRRVLMILKYEPSSNPIGLLKTPATLIRSASNEAIKTQDYDLSQYFSSPINIRIVDASHINIIQHPDTFDIIQSELDLETQSLVYD